MSVNWDDADHWDDDQQAGVVSTTSTLSRSGDVAAANPRDEGAGSSPASRSIRLTVIDDPVPMARPRVTVRGGKPHAYVPAKTQQSAWKIRQKAAEILGDESPFDGAVLVTATVYVKMPKSIPKSKRDNANPTTRPDLDRYLNTLLDGLSPLWRDDSQVVSVHIAKMYALAFTPRWVIAVEGVE